MCGRAKSLEVIQYFYDNNKKQTAGQWMGTLNKRLEAFRIAQKLID